MIAKYIDYLHDSKHSISLENICKCDCPNFTDTIGRKTGMQTG